MKHLEPHRSYPRPNRKGGLGALPQSSPTVRIVVRGLDRVSAPDQCLFVLQGKCTTVSVPKILHKESRNQKGEFMLFDERSFTSHNQKERGRILVIFLVRFTLHNQKRGYPYYFLVRSRTIRWNESEFVCFNVWKRYSVVWWYSVW